MKRRIRAEATPFTRAMRLAAAAIVASLAAAAIWGGAESMPWLANLVAFAGFPRGHGPRLLAGVLLALAALLVLSPSWSRRVAFTAAGALVFAGIATVSGIRATRLPGPDGPGIEGRAALAVAGVSIVAVVVGALLAVRAYRGSSPPPRGPSVAWRIVAAVVALGGGLAIAAPGRGALPPPLADTPDEVPGSVAEPEVESIDLEVAAWTGQSLAETPLAARLPGLVATVGQDPAFLVLYSGRCGTCHELFRERFSRELPRRVIAIEMPAAAGAVLAAGDGDPGDIDCPGCERTSLPAGPRWLVRPPTVVRVDAGIVTCVDDSSEGSCFAVSP